MAEAGEYQIRYDESQQKNIIYRVVDGAWIPEDPDNVDYQRYLKWVEEGYEAEPYKPPV